MAPRFEPLIEQHHDEIFAYLWRLLGKERRRDGALDVEDLVQKVCLRAYESFAGLRPNSNHRAWLYKIETNCAYTKLRQMKSQRDGLLSVETSEASLGAANGYSPLRKNIAQRVLALFNVL